MVMICIAVDGRSGAGKTTVTSRLTAVVPDARGETQASAPGQLPIQDVRRCLELLRV